MKKTMFLLCIAVALGITSSYAQRPANYQHFRLTDAYVPILTPAPPTPATDDKGDFINNEVSVDTEASLPPQQKQNVQDWLTPQGTPPGDGPKISGELHFKGAMPDGGTIKMHIGF